MSESNETKRDELESQIKSMQIELKECRANIKAAEQIVTENRNREHEITGGFSRHGGELSRLKYELDEIRRIICDSNARTVVWVEGTQFGHERNYRYVVVKITPKRIYTRREGRESQTFYEHSGKRGWGAEIDIAKTFPEGLEAFKSAPPISNTGVEE